MLQGPIKKQCQIKDRIIVIRDLQLDIIKRSRAQVRLLILARLMSAIWTINRQQTQEIIPRQIQVKDKILVAYIVQLLIIEEIT